MNQYIIDDIVLSIIFNDVLYQRCHDNGPDISFSAVYDTKEDAMDAANAGLTAFSILLNDLGISAPVTAYRSDISTNNPFGLFSLVEKPAGTYSMSREEVTLCSYTVADSSGGVGANPLSPYFPRDYSHSVMSSTDEMSYFRVNVLPASVQDPQGRVQPDTSVDYVCDVSVTYEVYKQSTGTKWVWRYIVDFHRSLAVYSTIQPAMAGLVPVPMNDPIAQGGNADNDPPSSSPFTGVGGGGTFQRSSDSIGWASTPVLSAADTGLVTLYVGSASNMHDLANFLWSGLFDIDNFKKLFISPMDCIIGASMLPVTPPNMPNATIIFGNVDTEVSMPRATQTYVTVDCGYVSLKEYWQAYLDYSPYTKVHIYLPFIGFKELNTDEVMGKNIGVRYMIDCLSGSFAVQIGVDSGATILAQYSGSCAVQVPLTANNWGNAISSVIQVAGQAIGGFASGGAAGALMSAGLGAANNAISGGFKPEIQRNGSVTGAGGWMASNKPYIIIEWPRQSKPESLNRFEGYPSNETLLLGACRGYTKVEEINLDGIPATAPELEEIESLLKGGVLI